MKKVLIITGIIVLFAVVAAGSFWGGMTYQTNKVNQARLNFENARGPISGGQVPGDGTGFPRDGMSGGQAPGGGLGGGMVGQIKTIEGDVMTVSTAQDVTTVNLTTTTQIQKTVAGTTDALQPGTRVMIAGQRDSNGNITATQITIINGELPGMLNPRPTQQEP
jgi:hypothetical protein